MPPPRRPGAASATARSTPPTSAPPPTGEPVPRQGRRAAHVPPGRGRPHRRLPDRAPRQGARRGQGRAPHHLEIRCTPGAPHPRRPVVVAGEGRPRHREPGRGAEFVPAHPGGPRPDAPRHRAPRGDRPDGPGAPPRPPALRHARRRARGPGRRAVRPDVAGAGVLPQGPRPRGSRARPRCLCRLRRARRHRRAGGLRPRGGRHLVPGPPQRAPHEPRRAGPPGPHPRRRPGRRPVGPDAARRPTRWPSWPPRPWRSISTAASARCARPRTFERLRGLRPRPVLPGALRLLRVRDLHRPRPPDGALRRRVRPRAAARREGQATSPRPPPSSSEGAPRPASTPTPCAACSTPSRARPVPR